MAEAALAKQPSRSARHEKLPPIEPGRKRQWHYCDRHERVGFRDYQPFSLNNPICIMPCGCDCKNKNVRDVTEAAAVTLSSNLMPPLTRAQRTHLNAALRNKGRLSWGAKTNGGGSMHRMCIELVERGYLEGPPFILTKTGRAALSKAGEV